MRLSSLTVGQRLTLNHVPFRVIRILETGLYQLERESDLAIINRSKNELLGAVGSGELCLSGIETSKPPANRIAVDLAGLSDQKQDEVSRKLKYVQLAKAMLGERPTYRKLEQIYKQITQHISDPNPPTPRTVYSWWKRWTQAQHSADALLDQRKGDKRSDSIPGNVESILLELIDEQYLKSEGKSKQDIYDALLTRINTLNKNQTPAIALPSRSSVYRYFERFDQYTLMAARKGKLAADKYFRATGAGVEIRRILERCEVDHTPLDLFVIDETTGLPVGRPFATFIIDYYSKIIIGFEIGFEPPSELSVMRALRNAIMPKHYVQTLYPEITTQWAAYGIPNTLVCDNGMEFHSHQLQRVCQELNIELFFCPRKQPHYKGSIERFMRTFNQQLCHTIPGTTFSNITERGDYDAIKNSCILLTDLKKAVHLWLIGQYNHHKHQTTKLSPKVAWEQGLFEVEPILPESKEQLDLILAIHDERNLDHQGVLFKGLTYNSAELAVLRHFGVKEVEIRVNQDDLGQIWVYDSRQGDYLRVPCIHPDYADKLTLTQHMLIRQKLTQESNKLFDHDAYLEGKAQLAQFLIELSNSKKLKERTKAARHNTPELQAHSSNTLPPAEPDWKAEYSTDEIPNFECLQGDQRHV